MSYYEPTTHYTPGELMLAGRIEARFDMLTDYFQRMFDVMEAFEVRISVQSICILTVLQNKVDIHIGVAQMRLNEILSLEVHL
jgi:hypothetical protein